MGHLIQWDNEEHTVVLQQYTDGACKNDLYMLADESARMLNTVDHCVHLIIDERNIQLALTTTDMQYLQRLTPKNQGITVVIVSPVILRYKNKLQNLGRKIAPDAFAKPYFAESVEAARAILVDNFDVKYP